METTPMIPETIKEEKNLGYYVSEEISEALLQYLLCIIDM